MSEISIDVQSQTKTELLVAQLGWTSRPCGDGSNLAVETCPICGNVGWKFFIHVGGEKDGLWDCKVCGQKGNFFQLRERLGIRRHGASSVREMTPGAPAPLPDIEAMHRALMGNEKFADVQDYLVHERRFSIETLNKLKLGADQHDVKMADGEVLKDVLWYVIPYLDAAGRCVYYKARSIPPARKAFRAPANREAMLYNETALKAGMEELYMVEGEADCIALINQGCTNVVGIPGARQKKAAWTEKLDRIAPKTIYICYDTDKVGQDSARSMAARIGIDRVKNLLLPKFDVPGKDGGPAKAGKDINEFFATGHTLADFEALKSEAKPFDVEGVQCVSDILDELEQDIVKNGAEPTYKTPWPSLTLRLGGCEDGDVIGLMAEGKIGKTTMGIDWAEWFVESVKEPAMVYCMEMATKRVVRKWVSHVTQTDDTPGKSLFTVNTVNAAKIIGANLPADLLFGYSKSRSPEDVCNTIRQAARRYGVKFVVLDNLQLMIHSVKEVAAETSKVTKMIKALAMELSIVILLIVQPNRVAEGQIVAARNANGSSAIEKDVDAMVCLHRERVAQIKASDFHGFLETESNFAPQLLCRVDLSRFSAGGTCTLYMDGATSTIRELTGEEVSGHSVKPTGPIAVEESDVQSV